MEIYEAIYKRRMTRDFQDKKVPEKIVDKIINAGLQAPTHDHLRNWEFIVLKDNKDKENVLQFIKRGVAPQLKILDRVLVNGTAQQKMYADAMPKQYTMLYNASHIILPFFKSTSAVLKPSHIGSLNPFASIWCVIENMLLSATAESLACSMRIPHKKEGEYVRDVIGAPKDYLFPCYLGIGYPANNMTVIEQVNINLKDKIHYGKW